MRDAKVEALLAALRGEETSFDPPAPPVLPEEPAPLKGPPLPPTPSETRPPVPEDMLIYLQTRVELLERKLEEARGAALRAELTLKEREAAQKVAQREVESMFRSMREQTRAAAWDKTLREQLVSEQDRVRELEERLRSLAVAALSQESIPPAPPPGAPVPPEPPYAVESAALAAMIGRVADLERRLMESEAARTAGEEERKEWEAGILRALKHLPAQWKRQGGPEALVEATLESLVDAMREREALGLQLKRELSAVDDEMPGTKEADEARAKAAATRRRIDELQWRIEKQSAVVEAWMKRQQQALPATP